MNKKLRNKNNEQGIKNDEVEEISTTGNVTMKSTQHFNNHYSLFDIRNSII